jgi:starvation-inducible outer membrane lipoprotein
MQKLFLIVTITCLLTSCACNSGFPKEINGKLQPINSVETVSNVR